MTLYGGKEGRSERVGGGEKERARMSKEKNKMEFSTIKTIKYCADKNNEPDSEGEKKIKKRKRKTISSKDKK